VAIHTCAAHRRASGGARSRQHRTACADSHEVERWRSVGDLRGEGGHSARKWRPVSAAAAGGHRTRRCSSRGQRLARFARRLTSWTSNTSRASRHDPLVHIAPVRAAPKALHVSLARVPQGNSLYFVLAAVGLFTLLVGASVRLKAAARSGDAALLLALRGLSSAHFTFSFNGALDRLDWIFYWGDATATALLAAAVAAFHAGVPANGRSREGGAFSDVPSARSGFGGGDGNGRAASTADDVRPGAAPRIGAHPGGGARVVEWSTFRPSDRP